MTNTKQNNTENRGKITHLVVCHSVIVEIGAGGKPFTTDGTC